jgi:hypothetical protein
VISWIITIWIFGSVLIFIIARALGGEVILILKSIKIICPTIVILSYEGLFFPNNRYNRLLSTAITVDCNIYTICKKLQLSEQLSQG